MEIERRYLLSSVPPFAVDHDTNAFEYEQGYIKSFDVIYERVQRRLPPSEPKYSRVVKIGHGIEREEFQENIDEVTFDAIWPATKRHRLHKKRWSIDGPVLVCNSRKWPVVWEITQFITARFPLVTAEVELPSKNCFVGPAPDWLRSFIVEDVTDNLKFESYFLGV